MPGGALSRPTIIVEPVVVIPDIDSKNASATLISNSENANGSAPTGNGDPTHCCKEKGLAKIEIRHGCRARR